MDSHIGGERERETEISKVVSLRPSRTPLHSDAQGCVHTLSLDCAEEETEGGIGEGEREGARSIAAVSLSLSFPLPLVLLRLDEHVPSSSGDCETWPRIRG